jgi:hypothetical protein
LPAFDEAVSREAAAALHHHIRRTPDMQTELVVDERGRTSLARVRSHHYDRYTVEEFADGTLVLTPAITISPLELAALRDPAVMAAAAAAKTGGRSALRRRPAPGNQEDLRFRLSASPARTAAPLPVLWFGGRAPRAPAELSAVRVNLPRPEPGRLPVVMGFSGQGRKSVGAR